MYKDRYNGTITGREISGMSNSTQRQFTAPLWFLFGGRDLLAQKAITLMREIDSRGSISRACASVPMSYRSAWDLVDRLNNLSSSPVILTVTGGRNGGGARLSEHGRMLLETYVSLQRSYEKIRYSYEDTSEDIGTFLSFMKGICMRTSARNQLTGTIRTLKKGMVNSKIVIDIGKGLAVVSTVTNESADRLELSAGAEVTALIKASSVILFPGREPPGSSAENILTGSIGEIRTGSVNSEVIISLASGKTITAVVTVESVTAMGIVKGDPIHAAFSASQVILAQPV